jgi:hypothetical protein
MATVKVEVTQDDINNGKRGECSRCPLALAIRRAVRPEICVLVGSFDYVLQGDRTRHNRSLPQIAKNFVRRFDDFAKCKPVSFSLCIPDDLLAPAEAPNV